jgi:hypothetical protein
MQWHLVYCTTTARVGSRALHQGHSPCALLATRACAVMLFRKCQPLPVGSASVQTAAMFHGGHAPTHISVKLSQCLKQS